LRSAALWLSVVDIKLKVLLFEKKEAIEQSNRTQGWKKIRQTLLLLTVLEMIVLSWVLNQQQMILLVQHERSVSEECSFEIQV
jgi:hypothetical protein